MEQLYTMVPLILAIAIFIEGTVEWFGQNYRTNKKVWGACALGIFATLALNFNPLTIIGVEGIHPMVTTVFGYFMGAVILSRGANYVNDFFSGWKK